MNMHRMRAIVALFLFFALTACGSTGSPDESSTATPKKKVEKFDVSGTVTVTSSSVDVDGLTDCIDSSDEIGAMDCVPKAGDSCGGSGPFDDVVAGAQVTVSDGSGKKVGLGTLSSGTLAKGAPDYPFEDTLVCKFGVSVPGIPDSGGIYSLSVAGRSAVDFAQVTASSVSVKLHD